MRIAIVVVFLLVFGLAVRGSDVYRHEIDDGSDLEKELGYKVSVQDAHESVPPKYAIDFHATVADKLKDLFELNLTLSDATPCSRNSP